VIVSPATQTTTALKTLWDAATAEAEKKRGGDALLLTIRGEIAPRDLLKRLIELGCVWSCHDGDTIVGIVICRNRVVETLYVDRHHRRQGVARAMLNELRALASPPLDAYALPGDRGTKSLYESIGWKARLLTMRGE
jgi:GNAT superfamily N-acetyltransferase